MAERNIVSWNIMISGYLISGDLDSCMNVFSTMPVRNLAPDVVSWNALLAGYIYNGHLMEAEATFARMPARNVTAWTASIAAFGRAGHLDRLVLVFDRMPIRNLVSWNTMIAWCSSCGDCKRAATSVWHEMVLAGEVPDETSFLSALLAFKHCGDLDAGWRCFVSASLDFGVLPGNPHYSCVLELLAKSGEMELAKDVAQSLPCDHVAWTAFLAACQLHDGDIAQEKL
ncbi:hypothetical protein SELMODRAFT_108836 [Selaginella moellendorffii]|uniref:Pentacotripeptide-repeat region of PRORP domain-containing protein n=1 Tax=Selaginella moellendorffii TaxID=88036 RepID=D8S5C3_SELML|nr:hypothetical protein SELMODRAFT_108836 [Selaginella moellendorffii]